MPAKPPLSSASSVGVDLGIKSFAVLSTGEKIANPAHFRKAEARLKVLHRRLDRKAKGGKNRAKARLRLAKAYGKVSNQREDFLHKLSTRLARENQTVIIEDLNVCGMIKNRSLSKEIGACGWGMFKDFLRYKCEWQGRNFVQVGRFEPSTKMCSCGVKNAALTLRDRFWTCASCGVTHDRDILAAQNIKRFGLAGKIQGGTRPVSLSSDPAVMGRVEKGISFAQA